MEVVIVTGIFLAVVLLIEGGYAVVTAYRNSETRRVLKKLRSLSATGLEKEHVEIIRKRYLSGIPWLNRLLLSVTRQHNLDRLVEQANVSMPFGFFVLLTLLLFATGYLVGIYLRFNLMLIIVISLLMAAAPYLYLTSRKQERLKKFQAQLTEALDMIARALRAGHAFTGGLKMVSDEFNDPVGTEFRKTLDEINFGINFKDAMENLAKRIDCPDLQFFVVSVIIQKETGGNLSEILEKIAHLIRERFKLDGSVRAISADGRLSAVILIILPFALIFYFLMVNPKYVSLLYSDRVGIIMSFIAVIMMVMGALVIKRMISIKV